MEKVQRERSANGPVWIAVFLIILLVVVLLMCSHGKSGARSQRFEIDSSVLEQLQIPALRSSDQIVQHAGYTLSYNEEHEQANWVAYVLTAAETASTHYPRTNRFLADAQVKTGSADDKDYEGSGYDRGHLAPAEDMAWSAQAMSESFYYSNMSPQLPAFNRGVWKRLEELVRYWSTVYDSIYIVTGPVFSAADAAIGRDRVTVPSGFYKLVLQYNSKGVKGIGFLLKNEASSASLKSFAVPIDSIEHLTGIDFFPKLPDDVESAVEADPEIASWKWTRRN